MNESVKITFVMSCCYYSDNNIVRVPDSCSKIVLYCTEAEYSRTLKFDMGSYEWFSALVCMFRLRVHVGKVAKLNTATIPSLPFSFLKSVMP